MADNDYMNTQEVLTGIKTWVKKEIGTNIYDISANHYGAKYADLSAALENNGANVPINVRKGGMSVKFLNTSDNYVVFTYLLQYANTTAGNTAFLNTANWRGTDSKPINGSKNLVESGGVQNELALGAVYDVSAKNPTAGSNNDGKWESLSALLSDANLNTLIPTAVRKGGMSIKFVRTYDNKYQQFFLTKDEWSINPNDWEKTNLKEEVSQVSNKVENVYTEDSETREEEQIWQSDSDNDTPEEYVKIGSYGIKAKGYYTLEGKNILEGIFGSGTTKYDLTADNLCGLMWDGSKVAAGGATFDGFLIELHEGRRVVYEAFGSYVILFDHKPTIGSVGTVLRNNYFRYIVPSSTQKYMLISGRLAGTQETYHIYEYGEGFSQSLMELNGKKIAFFGDSNTEGNVAYRDVSYPNYFGIYTGADVYNFGIGGTRLYPRGGSSDYKYLDIQNLINAKVNNDLTEQRNAATSLGVAKYSAIIDMLEQTDLSTFDAIVVGGGENDFIQGVSIDNVKNSMEDIFEKLATAYPNVKIYYVSPMFARYKVSSNPDVYEFADVYENSANYKKTDFVDWLCDCAKEQMIPFYDGYHNMGWNRYNFVTYFGDNTVHPVYGYKFMAQKIGASVTNDFIY